MTKPIKNKRAVITSGYGDRIIPGGRREFHGGIDIAVPGNPAGVPVYATCAGTVKAITEAHMSCGIAVFIQRDSADYFCIYMHLDFANPDISVGDHVEEGAYLGAMGNTGESRGTHLHYAHRKTMMSGGETYDPKEVSELY